MFDAKTIQKMELLVLSTLEWKMNPVTPLSFLDQIIRRLGLKNHLHWEFLRRCEALVLSLLPGKLKNKNRAFMFLNTIISYNVHILGICFSFFSKKEVSFFVFV